MKNKDRIAILVSSKSRPEAIQRLFRRRPELDTADTFLALERGEKSLYKGFVSSLRNARILYIPDGLGYPSNGFEALRQAATAERYLGYFLIHDNALFSARSLQVQMEAFRLMQAKVVMTGTGIHNDAMNIHDPNNANKIIALSSTKWGILHVVPTYYCAHIIFPHELFTKFAYPPNIYFEDTYFMLWCFKHGFDQFYTCIEASYTKTRFQPGGANTGKKTRVQKTIEGMLFLYNAFPEVVDHRWLLTRMQYKRSQDYYKENRTT